MLLTIVCAVAVGAAVFITAGLRDTRRPVVVDPRSGFAPFFIELVRSASALAAAGFVSGLLVAGFGGRLLMRILAATSGPSAQGRLTEAEAVVGEITTGGTLFLVFFGGLFGLLGGVGYYTTRRWLPDRSLPAGLVVAGIGGAVLIRPSGLLQPDSIDFDILGPRWLAALLGVLLIVGLGAVAGVLIDTFLPIWPRPSRTLKGLAGLVPLVLIVGVGPASLVVLTALTVGTILRPGARGPDRLRLDSIATLTLSAAGVVGWLWILVNAVEIAA